MKMSEMSEAMRPRERLLAEGVKVLNDAELLAILLRTGVSGGESALDLANRLLHLSSGSLLQLSTLPIHDLCTIPGIKENKAISVIAAFELGRRFCEEQSRTVKEPIISPMMAYRILIPHMKGLQREECKVIYLNNAQYFIGMETMSSGGGGSTCIDVPYIVRKALEKRASYVILSHNHPSGNPRPSRADIQYTKALREALSAMTIGLVDHVVVCDDCFYSFADDRVAYSNNR